MDTNVDTGWVAERLDALEPAWSPDYARAHVDLHERLERRQPRSWTRTASWIAAACLAAVVLLPQTRSFAQEVWARWTVGRFAVVHVGLPQAGHITMNGAWKRAASLPEASALAGFDVDLPASEAQAELTVLPRLEMSETLDVAALREALRRTNATDVHVPDSWDKLQIRADIGPTVLAEYADGAVISQAKPFPLYVPVGIPLTDIANAIFRSAGMPAAEAKRMALAFAIQPAWFLDIGKDEHVHVEQTTLANGPATIIDDHDPSGKPAERVSVLRSTADRLFLITGPTRERVIALAAGLK
jgi:hypothetical protein